MQRVVDANRAQRVIVGCCKAGDDPPQARNCPGPAAPPRWRRSASSGAHSRHKLKGQRFAHNPFRQYYLRVRTTDAVNNGKIPAFQPTPHITIAARCSEQARRIPALRLSRLNCMARPEWRRAHTRPTGGTFVIAANIPPSHVAQAYLQRSVSWFDPRC